MKNTPNDQLFALRAEIISNVLLPEGWKLTKRRGEVGYVLNDGLYQISDFFLGKPNFYLSVAALREHLANNARREGLNLARLWESGTAAVSEEQAYERSQECGAVLARRFMSHLPGLMNPATLKNQNALDEIEHFAKDRFAQAHYLSTIFNFFKFGPREYSAPAVGRYPSISDQGWKRIRELGGLGEWSEALDQEVQNMSAGDFVGSEPMISMELSRMIFRMHTTDLLSLLPKNLDLAKSSEHPSIRRFTLAVAKTFAYWLPYQGTQLGRDRLEAQHAWLIGLFNEAVAKSDELPAFGLAPPPVAAISPREAEELCCDWLRHLGAVDANVTQYTGDGGVDIASQKCIAQVKHYTGSVGAPEVYQFIGVASVDGRVPVFFTSGNYTKQAHVAASRAGLALFSYSAVAGTISAENTHATQIIREGL